MLKVRCGRQARRPTRAITHRRVIRANYTDRMAQLQNLTFSDAPSLVPFPLALIFVSIIGALIGSFLNVVIHRVPHGESIVFPNSRCPACETPIRPYDNIPILSFLILRGRCRACGVSISRRYPAIEALTAILFGLVFLHDGLTLALPFDLVFVAALVSLIFIDAEHKLLPDVITLPGFAFALVARVLVPNVYGLAFLSEGLLAGWPVWAVSIAGALFGAAVGGGSLWLMGWVWERIFRVEAMGLGDVKMMFAVGAFLGWPLTILTIFLAVTTASLIGIVETLSHAWRDTHRWKRRLNSSARMALFRRRTRRGLKSEIPFGVFLGFGSITSLLIGYHIINWYLGHFIP
jgi:leader peptidase (prepilin peptidase)/N-methyltransferase